MKLLIIGPQASGKGTQADMIAKRLGIPHISSGDIFRQHIRGKTELGLRVKSVIEGGQLVPDDLTWEVVKSALAEHEGWILDGYPRTIPQAELLDADAAVDRVLLLDVPDATSIERISGRRICPTCGRDYHIKFKPPKQEGICDEDGARLEQRSDDTPDSVQKRLAAYHEQTEPLIAHYGDKVVPINGDQGIQEVFHEIEQRLL